MAQEPMHGSSFESFEEAAERAMGQPQENHETFVVLSLAIERGGVVGRTQYHATIARSPLPANGKVKANQRMAKSPQR